MDIYTCLKCHKQFTTKKRLYTHLFDKSIPCDQKLSYTCQLCGAIFKHKSNMTKHIENKHNNQCKINYDTMINDKVSNDKKTYDESKYVPKYYDFGYEDYSYLTSEILDNIVFRIDFRKYFFEHAVCQIVELIYFNELHPENMTIRRSYKDKNDLCIRQFGDWKSTDRHSVYKEIHTTVFTKIIKNTIINKRGEDIFNKIQDLCIQEYKNMGVVRYYNADEIRRQKIFNPKNTDTFDVELDADKRTQIEDIIISTKLSDQERKIYILTIEYNSIKTYLQSDFDNHNRKTSTAYRDLIIRLDYLLKDKLKYIDEPLT